MEAWQCALGILLGQSCACAGRLAPPAPQLHTPEWKSCQVGKHLCKMAVAPSSTCDM